MIKTDLRSLFSGLQDQLLAGQKMIRAHSPHEGAKGSASEFNWIEVIEDFLPNRYSVASTIIVDCEGETSEQQDIVVFDRQYTPFILKRDGMTFIPAEGVYTVIEVKQTIDKAYIEYASEKAASVRRLRRTSARIHHAGGDSYKPRKPFHIPAGILAIDSEWNPPLGAPFDKAILNAATSEEGRIEYGCVLGAGAFRLLTNDEGRLLTDDEGSYKIEKSAGDASLMHFLLTLFHTLQQLATVPAIDILAYAKWLE